MFIVVLGFTRVALAILSNIDTKSIQLSLRVMNFLNNSNGHWLLQAFFIVFVMKFTDVKSSYVV